MRKIEVKKSVHLQNRNIYILPTKQGLLFALTLLVILMAAINFSNSLIYLFTFFLTSIAVISMLFTQKNLLGLTFQTGTGNPVYCGETASIPLHIFYKDHQFPDKLDNHFAINIKTEAFSQTIDPSHYSEPIYIPVNADKRGYIELPSIVISSTYPFGLFYAWSNIKLSTQTIAYPKPRPFQKPKDLASLQSHQEGSEGPGNSDFYGLDKYQVGESLKKVHWKAYAKGQGLYIKKYIGSDSSDFYWLDWNKFDQFNTEKRLSILSYLISEADKKGDHFGLCLPEIQININQGKNHKHQCLEQLALF